MTQTCPTCNAPVDATRFATCPVCLLTGTLAPIQLGEHLQLHEELGRGGMGVVYRAHDSRLRRDVAVKVLREDLASDAQLRERFEREARALASLKHRNIVPIFEVGGDGEQSWMVLELIEGPRLSDVLPLEPSAAIALTLEVAEALACAHASGVIHRDIKPENVLIDESGHARLVDFGLAALLDSPEDRLTQTGQAVGTPAYLAPEVLAGAPADERVDIYGVGVLFYQLITGSLPIGAFEPLDGKLNAFLQRALATDPDKRFPNSDELCAGLIELTAPGPATTTLPTEERIWIRAMAIVHTVATASLLWVFLISIIPRVADPNTKAPLISIREHSTGQIVERARFETGPTLAALFVVALAAALFGLLFNHWRKAGLLHTAPDPLLHKPRWIFFVGCTSIVVYALRLIGEGAGLDVIVSFTPILGGALELSAVYLVWLAVLDSWRTASDLRKPRLMWFGALLCLFPPAIELARFLQSWTP